MARPNITWDDWRSQLQHRITTLEALEEWIRVTPEEKEAIATSAGRYRWSVTPYYASLMDPDDPTCPIRQQAIPALAEFRRYPGASPDPVGDTVYRKTNRVVHKYPDRAIILVTELCALHCRHCTRKYHTADLEGTYFAEGESASWEPDFAYIEQHPELRDILLTGGDPLLYSNERLEPILARLRAIPHVEIIRIGSRTPVVLPQRITVALAEMLEQYHPVWFNTQFNHPREITPEAAAACDRLLRHGIVVQNQSVLLRGINDDLATMRRLLTELLKIRVRPYYLYHCDNAVGISHFVTSLEAGRALFRGLQGFITGFAVPEYVLTTPLGKIPLREENLHRDEDGYWIENYAGETMRIEEPLPRQQRQPLDFVDEFPETYRT